MEYTSIDPTEVADEFFVNKAIEVRVQSTAFERESKAIEWMAGVAAAILEGDDAEAIKDVDPEVIAKGEEQKGMAEAQKADAERVATVFEDKVTDREIVAVISDKIDEHLSSTLPDYIKQVEREYRQHEILAEFAASEGLKEQEASHRHAMLTCEAFQILSLVEVDEVSQRRADVKSDVKAEAVRG